MVLKKNRKTGYNGNVRAGIDSRYKVNLGGDLNVRQGKINAFIGGNYGQRKSISKGTTDRLTFLKSPYTQLHQTDRSTNEGYFAFLRGGIDYLIDNRNTLSVSGNLVRGKFDNTSVSNIFVDSLNNPVTHSFNLRNSMSEGIFRNKSGTLSYKHIFPKAGKEFSSDINYSEGKNSNSNRVNTDFYDKGYGTALNRTFGQQIDGSGTNRFFTAQGDYVNPLTDKSKIEMGARVAIRNVDSKNDIGYVLPSTGQIIFQPLLSSKYKNTDQVYAAYSTYTSSIKNFGYQVGLRAESSKYDGTLYTQTKSLADSSVTFGNKFPISLFPSLFLSQKLKNDQEIQLNYTRRVNRPNFFQLIPFTDYSDSLNLSRGNPGLKPEFTNSVELSYQKTFKGNNSLLFSAYYKNSTNLITRSQVIEVNPVKTGDTLLINTYVNANSSNVGGLELTSRNGLTKWWEMTTNLNVFTSKINITIPGITPQDRLYSFFAKMTHTIKLAQTLTLQVTGDYTSKTILPPGGSGSNSQQGGGRGGMMFGQTQTTAQGYIRPTYGVDAALRYEFLKNRVASVSLSVNDIFKTRRSDIYSASPYFTQNSFRTRDAQIFRLNLAYRFGKLDVSLFKRKNMRSGIENLQDQGQPQ